MRLVISQTPCPCEASSWPLHWKGSKSRAEGRYSEKPGSVGANPFAHRHCVRNTSPLPDATPLMHCSISMKVSRSSRPMLMITPACACRLMHNQPDLLHLLNLEFPCEVIMITDQDTTTGRAETAQEVVNGLLLAEFCDHRNRPKRFQRGTLRASKIFMSACFTVS